MVVLTSDHLIQDQDNFRHIITKAAKEAVNYNTIVTLGIKQVFLRLDMVI